MREVRRALRGLSRVVLCGACPASCSVRGLSRVVLCGTGLRVGRGADGFDKHGRLRTGSDREATGGRIGRLRVHRPPFEDFAGTGQRDARPPREVLSIGGDPQLFDNGFNAVGQVTPVLLQ